MAEYYPNSLLGRQERLSNYQLGGFHPIILGDIFSNGRYTVVHKLGSGGFSTVWVAHDKNVDQWVALKVMNAKISDQSKELIWFSTIAKRFKDRGSNYIVKLLDRFNMQGPNGHHQCLVFELLGPTVGLIVQNKNYINGNLDPLTILKMTEHMLKGVVFIHENEFGHGDISIKNMAFGSSTLANLTKETLFQVLGSPVTEKLTRLDGMPLAKGLPTYFVKDASWDGWVNEDNNNFRILDFGESFVHGKEPEVITQLVSLTAPETVLTDVYDYKIDLWRVGIAIYSLLFGQGPFSGIRDRDGLVMQMIEFIGDLPRELKPAYDELRLDFVRQPLLEGDIRTDRGLEYKFRKQIHEEMLQPLLPIIQGLMKFKPDERISASQALELLGNSDQDGKGA